ncbi:MAG: mannose-1-phosphate guanylyltransferase/mannose-6-phosphate isomerase [Caldiserica bacterium]|nr:MAG: mannose-1-phosphate guanylyltransferase/mannose-6-phosphate isomerase [Caldisericota bacterium]
MKRVALILAGGKGTRLWPLSREKFPKFFLKFEKDKSLIQESFLRLKGFFDVKDIFIASGGEYRYLIKQEIERLGFKYPLENILPEPVSRNTCSAITLGAFYFKNRFKDAIMSVFPADHIIKPYSVFHKALEKANSCALRDFLVTLGIKPDYPATGYGYIKAKVARLKAKNKKAKVASPPDRRAGLKAKKYYEVERFIEKPDIKKAKRFLKEGGYYWNAGIFVFKVSKILSEIEKFMPEIYNKFQKWNGKDFTYLEKIYTDLPDISIDYAVMEKSKDIALVPFSGIWSDVGCFEEFYKILKKDKSGNVISGRVLNIDSKNSFLLSDEERQLVTLGVNNLVVINTKDATLVMKNGEGQKVKKVFEILKNDIVTKEHKLVIKPWGWYKVLEDKPGYKVKILGVNPGERLSLQKHKYRDENWIVIKGEAIVTLDKKNIRLKEGESVNIPRGVLHRVYNPDRKRILEILELSRGEVIIEEDIIRLEDKYER